MNSELVSKRSLGRLGLVLLAGLATVACGGGPATNFTVSWRSPKAEPLKFKGHPVAAVVMMKDDIKRQSAEDTLAREITHYGAKGIQMYRIMPGTAVDNEAAARAAIEAAGVKGVVVMRPMGKRTKTETHESTYYDPMYGGMYGGYWGGYYGYGWNSAWGMPGSQVAGPPAYYGVTGGVPQTEKYTTTEELVVVEVRVYSLMQNLLVWAGESESTPPEKLDEFVTQLAAAAVKEMAEKGLLSN